MNEPPEPPKEFSDDQLLMYGKRLIERLEMGDTEELRYLDFCKGIVERCKMGNDSQTAICGPRFSGKSNATLTTELILNALGMHFAFDKNMFWGNEKTEDAVAAISTSRFETFDFDEGIKLSNKKRSMSSNIVLFEETLTQVRKKNHACFVCIPKFTALTKTIRNEIMHFWLEVVQKCSPTIQHSDQWVRVMMFARYDDPIDQDAWGIDFLEKNRKNSRHVIRTPEDRMKLLKKLKSYVTTFKIPRLPKKVEDYYEAKAQTVLFDFGTKIKENQAIVPTIVNGKEMYDAICARCNEPCQVPFKPFPGKPVYCMDCYKEMKDEGF